MVRLIFQEMNERKKGENPSECETMIENREEGVEVDDLLGDGESRVHILVNNILLLVRSFVRSLDAGSDPRQHARNNRASPAESLSLWNLSCFFPALLCIA